MVGIGRVQRRARSAPFDSAVFNEREASSGGLAAGRGSGAGVGTPRGRGAAKVRRTPTNPSEAAPGKVFVQGLACRSTGAREPALLGAWS